MPQATTHASPKEQAIDIYAEAYDAYWAFKSWDMSQDMPQTLNKLLDALDTARMLMESYT